MIHSIGVINEFSWIFSFFGNNFAKNLKTPIMKIEVNKSRCPHNHYCPLIRVCPVDAISQNKEGYPVINQDLCIECGACLHSCPMGAMSETN